jgi:hypothetical protein
MSEGPPPPLVIVDHLAGSRRGQRQELAAAGRTQFGRHPDCQVSFDAHRDIDASSRHAELRPAERGWVLVDLGSSNGTFVDGQRVTELAVPLATPGDRRVSAPVAPGSGSSSAIRGRGRPAGAGGGGPARPPAPGLADPRGRDRHRAAIGVWLAAR